MKRNVINARAMAALAGDSRHQAGRVILIAERVPGADYDARGVTLNTTRDDGTGEIHGAVFIAWTVDPAAAVRPVAYRQFIQPVIVPVEVALPSHTRTDHNLHPFALSLKLPRPAGYRRLVEPARLGLHLEIKSRVIGCRRGIGDHQHFRPIMK